MTRRRTTRRVKTLAQKRREAGYVPGLAKTFKCLFCHKDDAITVKLFKSGQDNKIFANQTGDEDEKGDKDDKDSTDQEGDKKNKKKKKEKKETDSKNMHTAEISCKTKGCGAYWESNKHYLSEPVDVYGDWAEFVHVETKKVENARKAQQIKDAAAEAVESLGRDRIVTPARFSAAPARASAVPADSQPRTLKVPKNKLTAKQVQQFEAAQNAAKAKKAATPKKTTATKGKKTAAKSSEFVEDGDDSVTEVDQLPASVKSKGKQPEVSQNIRRNYVWEEEFGGEEIDIPFADESSPIPEPEASNSKKRAFDDDDDIEMSYEGAKRGKVAESDI